MKHIARILLSGIFTFAIISGALDLAGVAYAADGQQSDQNKNEQIDLSGDADLQKLIKEVAPLFKQSEFNYGDKKLAYHLFAPQNLQPGKKYPLVLFMADATTSVKDVQSPLVQDYGALI